MSEQPRIVVTVAPDGTVTAETVGILGERCLDWIAVLEDLVDGRVHDSAYTTDYTREQQTARQQQVNRDVDPA